MHKVFRDAKFGLVVACRQVGKDMAMGMHFAQDAHKVPKASFYYAGTDNPTIKDIIWDKRYDDNGVGRQFLQDNIPLEVATPNDTNKEFRFKNGSLLAFKGYYEKNGAVGTSARRYGITELSLFKSNNNPLDFMTPIADNNRLTQISAVMTPRGKGKNPGYQWLVEHDMIDTIDAETNHIYKSKDGSFQVVYITADNAVEEGIFTPEQLDRIKDRYYRKYGNLNLFNQEYYCSFTEVNSALVYGDSWKLLQSESRVDRLFVNPKYPVLVAMDVGARNKTTDATTAIVFQYINGKVFILDEDVSFGKAPLEVMLELSMREWFKYCKFVITPWDASRSASMKTPKEEIAERFPQLNVIKLDQTNSVMDDINITRGILSRTFIDPRCQRLIDAFDQYEFSTTNDEEFGNPKHNRFSHIMDALRYGCVAIEQSSYYGIDFESNAVMSSQYGTQKSLFMGE
jgi:hypothetical protein